MWASESAADNQQHISNTICPFNPPKGVVQILGYVEKLGTFMHKTHFPFAIPFEIMKANELCVHRRITHNSFKPMSQFSV